MPDLDEDRSRRAAEVVCQQTLGRMPAEGRVGWALDTLPGEHIVSSSFGAQAAVMLHMLVSQKPDIPVVLIDTGYLFPETYRFIDELTGRLDLNLAVFSAPISPAWQEAITCVPEADAIGVAREFADNADGAGACRT